MGNTSEYLVIGNGIAALSCALLFLQKKNHVSILIVKNNVSPILTINYPTLFILKSLWGISLSDINYYSILNQHVAVWRGDKPTIIKTEPRIVISEDSIKRFLLERLQKQYPDQIKLEYFSSEKLLDQRVQQILMHPYCYDWIINANKSKTVAKIIIGQNTLAQNFGQRHVIYGETTFSKNNEQYNTTWMESTKDGWCFFAPITGNRVFVQAMVVGGEKSLECTLSNILNQTCFIKNFLDENYSRVCSFSASPRNSVRYCGDQWIAIGGAAFSFDPICGDGVGYALRSAILAYAVINAINKGFPKDECLEHYQMRLSETFATHIEQCSSYYDDTFENHAWDHDLATMKNYQYQRIKRKSSRYFLRNLELHYEAKIS